MTVRKLTRRQIVRNTIGLLLIWGLLSPSFSYSKSGGHSSTSGGGHSGHSSHSSSHASLSGSHHSQSYCSGCTRDSHGKIKRSSHAKHDFMKSHPCPSTGKTSGPCPGYVIDH